jgi:hypothetical protein
MAVNCAVCKGNLLCGRKKCPLLVKFSFIRLMEIPEGDIEKPTPPSVFVGRVGYPSVFIGPLVTLNVNTPELSDSPWLWEGSIEDVISFRMSMLRGMRKAKVNSAVEPDRFLQNLQTATASTKPVNLDLNVDKVLKKPVFDDIIQPIGISARTNKVEISDNPKIPLKVEKIYYDDVPSSTAVRTLFDHGFNTYYIQKIFSIGMIGIQKNRKLVPTRWSITAVHDMLGESLKREISIHPEVDEVLLFSYEHFGNHFEVILYPSEFNFEMIEIWIKESFWSPHRTWIGYDSEGIMPKKDYSSLSGGYYAGRLPVLEYLAKSKRKGGVIVLREITPDYYSPLGVWVVEEGVRRAMRRDPEKFDSISSAISKASSRIKTPKWMWKKYLKKQHQTSLESFL